MTEQYLQEEINRPENSGGGGGNWFQDAIWIDGGTLIDVADQDGTMGAPFSTISAGVAAAVVAQDALPVGVLPGQRAGTRQVFIVAGGIYDEDVDCARGDTFYEFLAMGPVTLGDGAGGNFSSTVPRSFRWVAAQSQENADAGGGSPIRRSQLVIGNLVNFGESSSTHTAVAVAWDISGDLIFENPDGGGGATTAEVHLGRVKVRGAVDGTADFGGRNCYFYQCFFDGAFTMTNVGGALLQICDSCEFDGPTDIGAYGRMDKCQIGGGFTTAGFSAAIPPGGMFGCEVSGTFTGPAGSAVMDGVTNYFFKTNGVTLGGGATKVIIDDLIP